MSYIGPISIAAGSRIVGPAGASGPPAGPNCVLLCHFDGVDGSTAFVDSSGKNHVFTSAAGASLTSAQAKFGATSFGKFPGAAFYWAGDDSSDFNFGTGDFTVDFWMYQAAFSPQCPFSTGPDPAFRPDVNAAGNGTARYVNTSSGGAIITSPVVIGLNSWHHIAFVRASAVAYLFVDGVLQGSAADTGNIVLGASPEPEIGAWTTGYIVTNGAMDELRILKGRAAWTANFTPPTAPYS
jgi:hypothetical protein